MAAVSGEKISVGAPWFEVAFAIPMIPLVFLMGVGMHTAWRSADAAPILRRLRIPAVIALVLGIAIPLIAYGRVGLLLCIGVIASVWIMAASLLDPIRSWRREKGAAGMTRSMLGMNIAHFGVGVFTLGVTIVLSFSIETDRALSPGQSVEAGDFRFEMRELLDVQGPNYSAREGVVDVRYLNGEFIGQLRPQKRQYLVQQSPMTEAGILAGWNRDLLISMGDRIGADTWSVRVQYKPLVRFIWFGCLLMAIGGLVAASDRRYRATAEQRAPVSAAAEPA